MSDLDISLVVVNYKTHNLLNRFLESLKKYEPNLSYEVIVVDVAVDRSPLKVPIHHFSQITYLSFEENIGYARACNAGESIALGRNVAFFNADTAFINSHCIEYCSQYLDQHSDVGAVGPMQIDSGGRVTHAGVFGTNSNPMPRGWHSRNAKDFRDNLEAVTISGSAYFARATTLIDMRNCDLFSDFDPTAKGPFLPTPHFYEETYLSYHLREHGYRVMYLGQAQMIHEWHKSSPVGSQGKKLKVSQSIFREACDYHGIEHD